MARITDIDEILGTSKKVRLHGEIYELPPDLPVELYLWINRLNDRDEADEMSEIEMVEKLYGEVLELFRYKRPDLKTLPISLPQLVAVIPSVYSQQDAEEDEGPRPPQRKASGGRRQTGSRTRR